MFVWCLINGAVLPDIEVASISSIINNALDAQPCVPRGGIAGPKGADPLAKSP